MSIDYTQLGERIRISRLKQNISQAKLAETLNVSFTYMGCLERGERRPSLDKLSNIALTLDVSTDWLLGIDLESRITSAFDDCSSEEADILIRNIKSLKSVLRSFSIKKK